VSAAEIEGFVIDRIRSIGRDSDLITNALNQVRSQFRDGTEKLKSELWIVNEELKRHVIEVDRIEKDITQSLGDHTHTSTKLADLEDQIRLAKQRAGILREQIDKKKSEFEDESILEGFNPIWESLLPRERTRLIHLIIKRIDYDGGEGTLNITFNKTESKTLAEEPALACAETVG
jgi:site-specific DNA recombinase